MASDPPPLPLRPPFSFLPLYLFRKTKIEKERKAGRGGGEGGYRGISDLGALLAGAGGAESQAGDPRQGGGGAGAPRPCPAPPTDKKIRTIGHMNKAMTRGEGTSRTEAGWGALVPTFGTGQVGLETEGCRKILEAAAGGPGGRGVGPRVRRYSELAVESRAPAWRTSGQGWGTHVVGCAQARPASALLISLLSDRPRVTSWIEGRRQSLVP